MANESAYQEFTGKSVEEALKGACEAFKVGIGDLDFEIIAASLLRQSAHSAVPHRSVPASQAALRLHQRPFAKSARHDQPHVAMHQ